MAGAIPALATSLFQSGRPLSPPHLPKAPYITVVICTRDRAARLSNVLSSFENLIVPTGLSWEICVVDNGSSDNTADVVAGFATRLPVRCVREEAAGLSNARNRGVAEAKGRYICWTDDDVELDERWLAAYAEAFERHPEAAVFGGRILPKLESPTPRWFTALASRWPLTTMLAARDFGDEIMPLTFDGGRVPWGANFAIRAEEQRQAGYDPNLGVSPSQRRLGEEAEVVFKIMSAGGVGWWVPGAKVRHIIPSSRQSRAYMRHYFAASGETLAYLEDVSPGANHMSIATPTLQLAGINNTSLLWQKIVAASLYATCRLIGAQLRSLYYSMKLAMLEGIEAYRRDRLRVS
jgi:glycosyltransferase involved in cell wall biosynthesis